MFTLLFSPWEQRPDWDVLLCFSKVKLNLRVLVQTTFWGYPGWTAAGCPFSTRETYWTTSRRGATHSTTGPATMRWWRCSGSPWSTSSEFHLWFYLQKYLPNVWNSVFSLHRWALIWFHVVVLSSVRWWEWSTSFYTLRSPFFISSENNRGRIRHRVSSRNLRLHLKLTCCRWEQI